MGITNDISAAILNIATTASTCKLGYVTAVKLPYTKKYPFWTAWPSEQNWEPRLNVEVGPSESHPHLWIVHYLIHTEQGANIDVEAAHLRMNDDVDAFMEGWAASGAPFLGGLVETSGDMRRWKNHPDGPFVEFAGRMCMGSYGLISVVAPALPFGCE